MTSSQASAHLAGPDDEDGTKPVVQVDSTYPELEESEKDLAPLLAALDSPKLTVFECLDFLVKHSDNIGVHFRLCQRLRTFPQHQIEFFLPQLVHIFVAYETESAALEDFLDELCHNSTHCTLIIFWHLQASLSDLEDQPQSYGFAAAKRLYNKIQNMIFAGPVAVDEQIRDNTRPAMVLASMVAASTAVPEASRYIRPLVLSQGRKQRSRLLRVANRLKRMATSSGDDTTHDLVNDYADETARHAARVVAAASVDELSFQHQKEQRLQHYAAAMSMPELSQSMSYGGSVAYNAAARRMSGEIVRSPLRDQLKTNYFRCETQFVYSLQSISNRLLRVPPPARLSALQLELALINRDLPAEVDIPLLIPDSSGSRHNRIVRISPTEATVLNSAEKVPYLLLVEYLKGDLTFNPDSERNRHLLQKNGQRKYLFDRNFSQAPPDPGTPLIESTFDEEEQDLGTVPAADLERLVPTNESQTSLVPDPHANGGLGAPLTRAEAAAAKEEDNSNTAAAAVSINDLASQMDMASIILSQLEGAQSGKLAKSEVEAIKSRIVANMQAMQNHDMLSASGHGEAGARKLENDLKTAGLSTSDDPSAANLAEDWTARKNRLRKTSPYGHYPTWDLFSVIVKTGDDLRQEALACQMISRARQIWREAHVDVWVKEMRILITSSNSGFVETITNGLSIHSIKKALSGMQAPEAGPETTKVATLSQHFAAKFGEQSTLRYQQALQNFVKSLAPYSLLCYLLQIKDRHNGNILLDNEGHIIHIDFGFMLSNSPGGKFALESAPFKLTYEYVELMGGTSSPMFKHFVELLKQCFHALRKHADEFTSMVEIMSKDSTLACFQNGPATALQLKQRFHADLTDADLDSFVENSLVYKSYGSIYTRGYDQFQMLTQGIYS